MRLCSSRGRARRARRRPAAAVGRMGVRPSLTPNHSHDQRCASQRRPSATSLRCPERPPRAAMAATRPVVAATAGRPRPATSMLPRSTRYALPLPLSSATGWPLLTALPKGRVLPHVPLRDPSVGAEPPHRLLRRVLAAETIAPGNREVLQKPVLHPQPRPRSDSHRLSVHRVLRRALGAVPDPPALGLVGWSANHAHEVRAAGPVAAPPVALRHYRVQGTSAAAALPLRRTL